MNIHKLVDAALDHYDYVVIGRGGAHLLRWHKIRRGTGGYWLSDASGGRWRIDTIEEAIAQFEELTGQMAEGFEVLLEVTR